MSKCFVYKYRLPFGRSILGFLFCKAWLWSCYNMLDSCHAVVCVKRTREHTEPSRWLNSMWNCCICLSSAWGAPEEFVISQPSLQPDYQMRLSKLLHPTSLPRQSLFRSVCYISFPFCLFSTLVIPPWEKRWNGCSHGEVLHSVWYFAQPRPHYLFPRYMYMVQSLCRIGLQKV